MADPILPDGYEAAQPVKKQVESLDSLSSDELAQFRQFMKQNKGKVGVVDRPALFVCVNSHASEVKEAQPDQSGKGTCPECGLPAGQWPVNVEWSPSAHKEGMA